MLTAIDRNEHPPDANTGPPLGAFFSVVLQMLNSSFNRTSTPTLPAGSVKGWSNNVQSTHVLQASMTCNLPMWAFLPR